jgi:hypothetical protein
MKYWEDKGKHTALFDKIWKKLVPDQGECENEIAELVRCFGRINYEMGNNGCCNMFEMELVDNSSWYDDEEDYDDEYEAGDLDEYYDRMFAKLNGPVDYSLMKGLEHECRNLANECSSSKFDKVHVIDEVGDALGDYIVKVCVDVETITSQVDPMSL